jgi:hypothetical protein
MMLPIIVGFVVGRFVRNRKLIAALGLTIGIAMGLFAGLEWIPVLYPFLVVRIPWVGVPEIRRVGIAFAHPDLVLYAESIHFQSFSLFILPVLLAAGLIGAILGVYLGIRFKRSDVDTPWESSDETG